VDKKKGISAGITFFYHKDIQPAVRFYEEIMGFQLVSDQGWAKIFRIAGNSYMGVVAGKEGFYQPQEKNAVLLTVVVSLPKSKINRKFRFAASSSKTPLVMLLRSNNSLIRR